MDCASQPTFFVRRALAPADHHRGDWLGSQTTLASAAQTGGQLGLVELAVLEGTELPTHVVRDHDVSYYVLAGEVSFHAGGRSVSASAGTFVHFPAGCERAVAFESASVRLLLFFTLGGPEGYFGELEEYLTSFETASGQLVVPDMERVTNLLQRYGIVCTGPRPNPLGQHPGVDPNGHRLAPGCVVRNATTKQLDAFGSRLVVLAHGAETGGRLGLVDMLLMPGVEPPMFICQREEIGFYVLEGELSIYVDGTTVPAPAGTFVFVPRGVERAVTIRTPAARYLLVFTPGGLEGYFEELAAYYDELAPDGTPLAVPDPERLIAKSMEYGVIYTGPRPE